MPPQKPGPAHASIQPAHMPALHTAVGHAYEPSGHGVHGPRGLAQSASDVHWGGGGGGGGGAGTHTAEQTPEASGAHPVVGARVQTYPGGHSLALPQGSG